MTQTLKQRHITHSHLLKTGVCLTAPSLQPCTPPCATSHPRHTPELISHHPRIRPTLPLPLLPTIQTISCSTPQNVLERETGGNFPLEDFEISAAESTAASALLFFSTLQINKEISAENVQIPTCWECCSAAWCRHCAASRR